MRSYPYNYSVVHHTLVCEDQKKVQWCQKVLDHSRRHWRVRVTWMSWKGNWQMLNAELATWRMKQKAGEQMQKRPRVSADGLSHMQNGQSETKKKKKERHICWSVLLLLEEIVLSRSFTRNFYYLSRPLPNRIASQSVGWICVNFEIFWSEVGTTGVCGVICDIYRTRLLHTLWKKCCVSRYRYGSSSHI